LSLATRITAYIAHPSSSFQGASRACIGRDAANVAKRAPARLV